jgi:hypothetical protein
MRRDGPKRVLLVESDRSYDRREVVAEIAAKGAEILPVLRIKTRSAGGAEDSSRWAVVYRPATDELAVDLEDTWLFSSARTVLHFADAVGGAQARSDCKAAPPDVVSGLSGYQERVRRAVDLPAGAPEILDACLRIAELRNVEPGIVAPEMEKVLSAEDLVPHDIKARLQWKGAQHGRCIDGDRVVISAVTELVEHLLASKLHPSDRRGPSAETPDEVSAACAAGPEMPEPVQGLPPGGKQSEPDDSGCCSIS